MSPENTVKIFRLSQVTASIQATIQKRYSSHFWVTAEINRLNHYSHSGHCYPELVEKVNGKILAEIRSVLWKDDFVRINQQFITQLQTPLKDGIKVLMLVKVAFNPISGIQLQIKDIDPVFTLGDLEREKNESVAKLKSEKIFDLNKSRPLPLLPKRIAIISAQTSKGYSDFIKILDTNPHRFTFFHMLFPAYLQGDRSVDSIVSVLQKLEKVKDHFDVVAIIRGGGGDVGLSTFNNFELAKAIATFPLPVITGIGHATNDTVSEMVSYYNAITPTQSSGFLIKRFEEFSVPVEEAVKKIQREAELKLSRNKELIRQSVGALQSNTKMAVRRNSESLMSEQKQIAQATRFHIKSAYERVQSFQERTTAAFSQRISATAGNLTKISEVLKSKSLVTLNEQIIKLNANENQLRALDPENVLQRGYSITKHNGSAVSSLKNVMSGDTIESILLDGTIKSKVTEKITDGRKH